jgi:hypothetical protein
MTIVDSEERRSRWPGLMRPATARAYLDGLYSRLAFEAEVAPHLERRLVHGKLAYTKESLDAWIDRTARPGELRTPADLARALDNDDDHDRRGQGLRQ